MNKDNLEKIVPQNQSESSNTPTVIKTDVGAKDGQNKCPKCGGTEISLNVNTGKLRCEFCRFEFEEEKITGLEEDITKLKGKVMGSGAQDIVADAKDIITFKCSSCGAEVVVDTSSASQAKCHWCRNILSVNQQIPNGSIPDVVLPFAITKDEAKQQIEAFVGKRKFYAHPEFKKQFTTENIMGVYFPYMIVDINSHVNLNGKGEKLVRTYTRGSGDNKRVYYDADLYRVEREFDLTIDGLTIESNSDRLNNSSSDKTNNVINSIMPFDIENCSKYNANYLKGYTSERRDTNVEQIRKIINIQAKDIARFSANDSIFEYNRGVSWENENFDIKGEQWKAAYLPVWLYSYQQVSGNKKVLHYVAVNARTRETMGSVPIHMPKLILMSLLVEIAGVLGSLFTDFDGNWFFSLSGIVFFLLIYFKYRNSNARHKYEKETKTEVLNLKAKDEFIKRETGLKNSSMEGANNRKVYGANAASNFINSITEKNPIANLINNNINKGDK